MFLSSKKQVFFCIYMGLELIALKAVGPHECDTTENRIPLRGFYQADHERLQWRFSANQGKLHFQKTLIPHTSSVRGDLSWAFGPTQNNYRLKTLCLSKTSSGNTLKTGMMFSQANSLHRILSFNLKDFFALLASTMIPFPYPFLVQIPF